MAEAERQSGKYVAIGYQWSFTPTIQALKRDIMAGVFGRPKWFKTCILWPRLASYYQRNRWAGRITSDSGEWVLDSPANNAMAHYLHNALFILGDTPTTSARAVSVQAELYRANPIENYDAAALRVLTEGGVEVLFYGAHPVSKETHPVFCLELEDATIEYNANHHHGVIARLTDGSVRKYGSPDEEWEKLWQTVNAIRTGVPVACGIDAASAHTLCINGAQESTEITAIPHELIRQESRGDADTLTWAFGLHEIFTQSYDRGCLPSEIGVYPWTRGGKVVNLLNYGHFPLLS
jgi:predicted dehydrogenase